MLKTQVYINYLGDCEAAFRFYHSILGGQLKDLTRFSEMPQGEGMPPLPDEMKNMIMHVELHLNEHYSILGSDTGGEWAPNFRQGTNYSVYINAPDQATADRVYHALSEGGEVTMPIGDTFWGAYFGMCTDRFGIQWMVSFDKVSS